MAEIVKDIYAIPTHDLLLNRSYEPEVVLWQLTTLGTKRITESTLPSNLPLRADEVLKLLYKLGYTEEDELISHTRMSPKALAETLDRLKGFGYIQRVHLASAIGSTTSQSTAKKVKGKQ